MRTSKMFRRLGRSAVIGSLVGLVVLQATPGKALEQADVERIMPSLVQLGVLYRGTDKDTGKPFQGTFPWGNGSFVSATGYILTSATTANVGVIKEQARKDGIEVDETTLVVSIAKTASAIPAPAYLAKVLSVDPVADLGLLQVATDLAGRAIPAGSVAFPPLPFGNADALKVGDKVTAFGYVKRDDSASFSTRSVKNFASDSAFAGRSVIGLSTAMPSGMVGASAVDASGKLIGVAAFAVGPAPAVDAAPQPCTPTVDTNRDGRIDKNDTCAPPDPGIGYLRTSNAVFEFFAKYSKGATTPSTTRPQVSPPPTSTIPKPTIPISITPVPSTTLGFQVPTTVPRPTTTLAPPATTLAPPTTRVAVAPPPKDLPSDPTVALDDVYMFGYVFDSATGRPIADGYTYIFKPGTDIRKTSEKDLIAFFKWDKKGKWGSPSYRWKRGENYPIAFYADNYEIAFSSDFRIEADAEDPLRLDLQLDPK